MVPIRSALRNRWWTLAWAVGILWGAVSFAGGDGGRLVDAANSADGNAAQAEALAAES